MTDIWLLYLMVGFFVAVCCVLTFAFPAKQACLRQYWKHKLPVSQAKGCADDLSLAACTTSDSNSSLLPL